MRKIGTQSGKDMREERFRQRKIWMNRKQSNLHVSVVESKASANRRVERN